MTEERWDTSTLGRYHKPSDIVRCYCGSSAGLMHHEGYYWVQCLRTDCWHGPVNKRRDKALKVWNDLMKKEKQ